MWRDMARNADKHPMRREYSIKNKALPAHLRCAPNERVQVRYRVSPAVARILALVGAAEFGGRPDSAGRALELAVARAFGDVALFSREDGDARPAAHPTASSADTLAAGREHVARLAARPAPAPAPGDGTDSDADNTPGMRAAA
jgi:hypothetical protein